MFLRYRTGSLSKMLARCVISHDCQSKFAQRFSVQSVESVEPSLHKFSQPDQILGFKWMHQQEEGEFFKRTQWSRALKGYISSPYRAASWSVQQWSCSNHVGASPCKETPIYCGIAVLTLHRQPVGCGRLFTRATTMETSRRPCGGGSLAKVTNTDLCVPQKADGSPTQKL